MSEGPGLGAGGGGGGIGAHYGHEEQQLEPWHCGEVVVERCRTRQDGHDSKGFEQNQKGTLEGAANVDLHSRGGGIFTDPENSVRALPEGGPYRTNLRDDPPQITGNGDRLVPFTKF
jgi:hypothetical protein